MIAPRRRWFSYSLRTGFVLLTLLGMALGWVAVNLKWIRDRRAAAQWYYSKGCGPVHWELPDKSEAPFSLRMFGECGWRYIYVSADPAKPSAADQRERVESQLKQLFPEAQVFQTEWHPKTQ